MLSNVKCLQEQHTHTHAHINSHTIQVVVSLRFHLQEFLDSRLSTMMSFLTSIPRAAQLLDKEPKHTLLVNSLEQELRHYLQQVHRHTFRQDKR